MGAFLDPEEQKREKDQSENAAADSEKDPLETEGAGDPSGKTGCRGSQGKGGEKEDPVGRSPHLLSGMAGQEGIGHGLHEKIEEEKDQSEEEQRKVRIERHGNDKRE
jgi:hypothetical protein